MKLRNKKLSNYSLLDIINISAVFITLLVFILIAITLNRGEYCDESFYLLGYCKQQLIGDCLTQFHYIIRPIAGVFSQGYVNIGLRWTNLILLVLSLLFFSSSTFSYLKENFKINISKTLFFSITILAGFMGFNFGSAVLYYDNLQAILYLIILGLLFFSFGKKSIIEFIVHLLSGFFILFAAFNYLSSGLNLFIIYIILLFLLPKKFDIKLFIKTSLYVILGFFMGIVFYHYEIRNIPNAIESIISSLNSAGNSHHEIGTLVSIALKYTYKLILFFSLFVVIGLGFFYLLGRFKSKWVYIYIILSFIFIFIFHNLVEKLYSYSLILPISFAIAHILMTIFKGNKVKINYREIILILIFLLIPLAATFGTNLRIESKSYCFISFWIIAFIIIFSKIKVENKKSTIFIYSFLWFGLLFGNSLMGLYIKRFSYTYPLMSCELSDNAIGRIIKVSKYEMLFNDKVISTLDLNGFKKGDDIFSFYDYFSAIYAAGGHVYGNLINYTSLNYKKNIPIKPSNYILIAKSQELLLIKILKDTDWQFPENYKRIDLEMSSWLVNNEPSNYCILFVRKEKI